MKSKFLVLMMAIVMVFSTVSVASATTYEGNSKGKSFKREWSVTAINDSTRTFKYGYDTTLINEDFCHTYHKSKKHTAYVKNTNRSQNLTKGAGKYAKAEITHKGGGTVYYTYTY